MGLLEFDPRSLGAVLMVGAAVGLYASARAGAEAAARLVSDTGFTRAVFHWVPVAAVVMTAAWTGRWDLAVGVVFGTSVAAVCLIPGVVAVSGGEPSLSRRAMFLFPAALLALMCGFSGQLRAWHAVALAVEGLAILAVAERPIRRRIQATVAERSFAVLDVVLSVLLALLTAWAANRAATHLTGEVRPLTPGVVGALMLGPALMLPLLGTAQALLGAGRAAEAAELPVPVVLLNLCLLLPAAVFVAGRNLAWDDIAHIFPLVTWRVDAVILTVVGGFLLPAAVGRWRLGRGEGAALVIAYCVYLVVALRAGARPA